MTVLEVIQRSTEFLQKKGVDSPRLQAELLLAHYFQMPRMRLYLDFERVLSPQDLQAARELVMRRARREPLQQITGSTSFCGLEITVNRSVLIPRPETELLAERAWDFLAQPAVRQPGFLEVLDFGTGSGCLAITLAVKSPSARVVALDVSAESLEVAKSNAVRHGVADRVQFLQGQDFTALPADKRFVLVVSNPPYIPTAEIQTLAPEVREHEPHHALDGGEDGLRFYRQLAAEAAPRLVPNGRIMVEFGDDQQQRVSEIFESQNWVVEQIAEDYTHRPRILIAQRNAWTACS